MKRFLYELSESWKIAVAQMRSNKTRSTLTALGVIIGIVAVTLMGTAIAGIQVGFEKSMAIFGDDVLYVSQWPWKPVDDWWNYRDRKKIKTEYAEPINRIIAATPNSNLVIAVPTSTAVTRSVTRKAPVSASTSTSTAVQDGIQKVLRPGVSADPSPRNSVSGFNRARHRRSASVCRSCARITSNPFQVSSPAGQASTVVAKLSTAERAFSAACRMAKPATVTPVLA